MSCRTLPEGDDYDGRFGVHVSILASSLSVLCPPCNGKRIEEIKCKRGIDDFPVGMPPTTTVLTTKSVRSVRKGDKIHELEIDCYLCAEKR